MLSFVQIGKALKSFGKEGRLKCRVQPEYKEELLNARALFFKIEGNHVPFLIEDIINDNDLKIKFKDIDGPEQTFPLVQSEIFLAEEQFSEGFSIPLNEERQITLLDYSIRYGDLSLAPILRIEEYPQQVMLFINVEGEEKMIPWVEDWVIEKDDDNRVIEMKIPEGLL